MSGSREGPIRRVIVFPLSLMLIGGIMVLAAAILASNLVHLSGAAPNSPLFALGAGLTALAVIAAYKAFKRWIERAPDGELPAGGAIREAGLGLVCGVGLFAVVVVLVMALGGLEILGLRGAGRLWSLLAMAIVSGVFEEVLFRGLIQRQLEALLGSWAALGLTSACFGIAHAFNPGASWWSALAIALEAGVLLGGAFLLTRRLWLPIGVHMGWNFAQGWIFSLPVSGGEPPQGLLVTQRHGPEWLTGGDFGLEASAVAMAVALVAGALLVAVIRRRKVALPPAWRRQTKL